MQYTLGALVGLNSIIKEFGDFYNLLLYRK